MKSANFISRGAIDLQIYLGIYKRHEDSFPTLNVSKLTVENGASSVGFHFGDTSFDIFEDDHFTYGIAEDFLQKQYEAFNCYIPFYQQSAYHWSDVASLDKNCWGNYENSRNDELYPLTMNSKYPRHTKEKKEVKIDKEFDLNKVGSARMEGNLEIIANLKHKEIDKEKIVHRSISNVIVRKMDKSEKKKFRFQLLDGDYYYTIEQKFLNDKPTSFIDCIGNTQWCFEEFKVTTDVRPLTEFYDTKNKSRMEKFKKNPDLPERSSEEGKLIYL